MRAMKKNSEGRISEKKLRCANEHANLNQHRKKRLKRLRKIKGNRKIRRKKCHNKYLIKKNPSKKLIARVKRLFSGKYIFQLLFWPSPGRWTY